MNDFISKPVDPEAFFTTLLQWLQLRPPQPWPADDARPGDRSEEAADAQDDDTAAGVVPTAPDTDALPELPGINTAVGLGYLLGKKEFYLRLLQKFRDEHVRGFLDKFRWVRSANDWLTATRLAHTLKGLAHSIGAADLGDIAAALERATLRRDVDAVTVLENAIEQELARILPGLLRLGPLIDAPLQSPVPPAAPGDCQALAARLRALLEANDTAAAACFGELSRALAGAGIDVPEMARIRHAIASFDYRQAVALLSALPLPNTNAAPGTP